MAIEIVASALGELKGRSFLTGGVSIPFYITDPLEEPPRATLDIDVAIEVYSAVEFRNVVEARLRDQGFVNDTTQGAPICRWKWDEIIVDIMPIEESVLGFTNPWFQAGIDHMMPITVTEKCSWRVLSAPFALAAKLEAFWSRGAADPGSSHDLEDILTIVNGRLEVVIEVGNAPEACQRYVAESFNNILTEQRLLEVLSFHMPYGQVGQQRLSVVLDRMRQIAGI
jgi:hypothetical protein